MAVSPRFQAFILDLLVPLAPSARRMFSGAGLFEGGVMFGLLVRDTLYFRVDDTSRVKFEAAGAGPFTYNRAGREVSLASYYAVPEELFDEPDELLRWARDAVMAAHAAHAPKPRRARANGRSAKSR